MAVFFRLDSSGIIYCYGKPFSKTILPSNFYERAIKLEFKQFVKRFIAKEHQQKLIDEMEQLKKLDHLTKVGPKFVVDDNGEMVLDGCCIGRLYFNYFYKSDRQKEAAIEYGYRHYPSQMMDEWIIDGVFEVPSEELMAKIVDGDELIQYYINNIQISKEEYQEAYDTIKSLTRIREVKKPLEDSNDIIVNKKRNR